ncbi:MAG: hypothetical protein Phyf2KO_14580 [Phycisphaerales bacterium]
MSLRKRREAAAKYKPDRVRLLLVAEAPPCAEDRYFYFEDVDRHDWLFRYVWEGLTGDKPEPGKKAEHLEVLRDMGVFLVDLHEEAISKPTITQLVPEVPGLVSRCDALDAERIILIKSVVYDAAFGAFASSGLPVADARIPFPASGQQKKFLELFRAAVAGFEFAAR